MTDAQFESFKRTVLARVMTTNDIDEILFTVKTMCTEDDIAYAEKQAQEYLSHKKKKSSKKGG
jgi:hypothetical protein